ncbi:MAG: hypothetical protein OCU20_03860 [Methanophagales archaeon]|nr:hypothetical protein [Methanophagales archaeon]
MLRPVEMRELRIITLDEHLDNVIKRIDALGSVHLTDIEEFMDDWVGLIEPAKADSVLMKISELLTRIDNLLSLLQQPEEGAKAKKKKSLKDRLFKAREEEEMAVVTVTPGEERSLAEIEEEFSELEKIVIRLTDETARLREELKDTEDLLAVLKELVGFGVEPGFIGDKYFISVFAGRVPTANIDELDKTLDDIVGELHFVITHELEHDNDTEDKSKSFAIVVAMKHDRDAVEKVLTRMDFDLWSPPADISSYEAAEAIEESSAKIKRLRQEIELKEREVEEIRATKLSELTAMRETLQMEENKAKVKALFGQSERVRVIMGWTPEDKVEEVTAGIREETGGLSIVEAKKPEREDARVPSLLRNPKLLKPFESVIKMYGHPLYRDIDPTLITAIIFPILFGLMFPDIGHGFILVLLGLALTRFTGLSKEMRDMGIIILLCGLCSMVAGTLFGEFFGFSLYARELVSESVQMHIPDWLIPIKNPVMEPIVQVKLFFVITLLIGAAHMGLGLVFNVINQVRAKRLHGMINELVKIWCLAGALYFLLVLFGFYFTELQEHNTPVLLRNVTIFVLLPIALLFILKVVEELRHEGGEGEGGSAGKKSIMDYLIILIDGVIDALLENFFRFLANTVSYGRILALALCHAALIEVFIIFTFMCLKMPVPVLGPVMAALVFLLGTALVIVLEAIMAGIHTIRLHFYEWFTKFYEGGGHEFSPFKLRVRGS